MLRDVERCEQCGFEYREARAAEADRAIGDGAAALAAILELGGSDLGARREPARWSPLEYACHVRDMLLVQRERLLAARRRDRPLAEPMGREERVELDGYAGQHPADVARQLRDAAQLFGNDLARLGEADWDRRIIYTYPHRAERSLRWLAIHTLHEVRHHLLDVRAQLPSKALPPAEREARWRLLVRFAVEAGSEHETRVLITYALAVLGPGFPLRGDPAIRPRHRHIPDDIWIAELHPDLTQLPEIDPDDATTRCSFVAGHFPAGVTWAAPRNSVREATREWPPGIWQQPGRDDVLLHPAVRAVMICCAAADSRGGQDQPPASLVIGTVEAGPIRPIDIPGQPHTRPVPGAAVEARRDGDVVAATRADDAGHYQLTVQPGSYLIRAAATGLHSKQPGKMVTIFPAETLTVRFVLDTGIR
jgi:hypothetical protein